MAGHSVKLFQFIKKYYQIMLGIYSPESANQNRCSFKRKNWCFLFGFSESFVLSMAFLLSDGKSMYDSGSAFFLLICTICTTSFYLISIWEMGNMTKLTENCEVFIEKSKC